MLALLPIALLSALPESAQTTPPQTRCVAGIVQVELRQDETPPPVCIAAGVVTTLRFSEPMEVREGLVEGGGVLVRALRWSHPGGSPQATSVALDVLPDFRAGDVRHLSVVLTPNGASEAAQSESTPLSLMLVGSEQGAHQVTLARVRGEPRCEAEAAARRRAEACEARLEQVKGGPGQHLMASLIEARAIDYHGSNLLIARVPPALPGNIGIKAGMAVHVPAGEGSFALGIILRVENLGTAEWMPMETLVTIGDDSAVSGFTVVKADNLRAGGIGTYAVVVPLEGLAENTRLKLTVRGESGGFVIPDIPLHQ